MVLAGVTLWSVTNPLTIFKMCILECVTGWTPKHVAASGYHCHHVFLTTSRTRQSRPAPLLPSDNHLLGCDDRCVVVATAIFMDRCSSRQKVRRLWLRRRFADPLSTNNLKSTSCSLMSWHSTSPSSLKYLFGTRRDGLCSLPQQHRSVFLRPRPQPQVLPCARKGRVGEVLRWVKFICPA